MILKNCFNNSALIPMSFSFFSTNIQIFLHQLFITFFIFHSFPIIYFHHSYQLPKTSNEKTFFSNEEKSINFVPIHWHLPSSSTRDFNFNPINYNVTKMEKQIRQQQSIKWWINFLSNHLSFYDILPQSK